MLANGPESKTRRDGWNYVFKAPCAATEIVHEIRKK
jgi:hypothetical protein